MQKSLGILFSVLSLCAHAQVSLQLDEVPLIDLVKLTYGEIGQRSYFISPELIQSRQPFSLSIRDSKPDKLLAMVTDTLHASGFEVLDRDKVVIIRKSKPEHDMLVYRPKYRSAKYLAEVVRPLIQDVHIEEKREPIDLENPAPKAPKQAPKQSTQGDETQADQTVFKVKREDRRNLEKLLADLDTPTGEVLLKAAVYEVGTTRQDGSAIELALSIANPLLTIDAKIGQVTSGNYAKLTVDGKLSGVISALERDNRFKSLSRPQVRVRNGAKAEFTVGQDVPILGNTTTSVNGTVQAIEYKPSGIILTASPQIRQGEIELQLHQELSSFVTTSNGVNNSPTLTKRAVKTAMTIQPGEVVILAGLQDEKDDKQQSRLPVVGWLLGDQDKRERSEVLIFIEAQRIEQSEI